MKVIFLDIDGVLNSEEWAIRTHGENLIALDEVAVQRLFNILAITDAKIVLSSTWRLVPEMIQILRDHNIPIHDVTGRRDAFDTRHLEIQDWLTAHSNVTAFAIVDDDPDAGYGAMAPHFVQTDFRFGLTKENADRIIALLGASP